MAFSATTLSLLGAGFAYFAVKCSMAWAVSDYQIAMH
jgi:hypothetical protein